MKVDLEKIRKMNDEELSKFLNKFKNGDVCARCGGTYTKENRTRITVSKPSGETHWKSSGYSTKKLCNLCENCYNELLAWIGIEDVLKESE